MKKNIDILTFLILFSPLSATASSKTTNEDRVQLTSQQEDKKNEQKTEKQEYDVQKKEEEPELQEERKGQKQKFKEKNLSKKEALQEQRLDLNKKEELEIKRQKLNKQFEELAKKEALRKKQVLEAQFEELESKEKALKSRQQNLQAQKQEVKLETDFLGAWGTILGRIKESSEGNLDNTHFSKLSKELDEFLLRSKRVVKKKLKVKQQQAELNEQLRDLNIKRGDLNTKREGLDTTKNILVYDFSGVLVLRLLFISLLAGTVGLVLGQWHTPLPSNPTYFKVIIGICGGCYILLFPLFILILTPVKIQNTST